MEQHAGNGKHGGGRHAVTRHLSHLRTEPRTGSLVLIGGACEPEGEALGAFIRLARGREGGRIVGITTASADPANSAREWLKVFTEGGCPDVKIPVIDRRDRAQDARIAQMVREADGIFLGGGDQVHLVATIAGSRVARAIREAHAAGAVVCGTSAGAAALTETILAGAEPDEYGQMQELHLGPGFGLLGFGAVIDTHFTQRRRLQRLFMVVAQNPELMGLGIDEDTALVVHGHVGEVVGRGSVTFVDGRGVRFDNADECMVDGRPLTLSYLRVGIVGAPYALNLRVRELEVIVQRREGGTEQTPIEVVRSERASVEG
ncbi:MAG TPA: cyanophycinase [Longimicrobium sp.]|nr:cyanophycinase [Longimicrobium sp.]